ncbi:aldehyde dehydrogenase [Catenulispora yoronensis]|uniref:aldehyde dehydrogenase (NAD(+)) n=1 Tax=Catenulispora yoronensis TaxID=450799 RepID=A0ABN2TXL7_9ACTN
MGTVTEHGKLFIGGSYVDPATDAKLEVISPVTEEVFGRTPEAAPADMDRAVGAARRAFDEGPWPRMSVAERVEILRALRNQYEARADELARLISAETGSPYSWSILAQVWAPIMIWDTFLGLAEQYPWEELRPGLLGPTLVRSEPIGVAAAIVAWNVPQFITVSKIAPALAAGCAVIVKPSPETALDSYLLADMAQAAGLPEGVLSIVPAGRENSAYLAAHPGLDKIGFTGSTGAGKAVLAAAAPNLTRVTLELGGKSAAIILPDADLDVVVPGLLPNAYMNNGQACIAQTRVLVQRERYAETVEALAEGVRGLRIGDPLDPETQVGPLVAERQRDRVESYIAKGIGEGARAVVGGGRPRDLTKGWYVEPTLFADVDNRMVIAQEEIFGPVVAVIPYEDEADAVRIANDSDYGLSGSVWGADTEHALTVARQVRAGNYGVNNFAMEFGSPFGGFKQSGIGREFGPEGLRAYLETKSMHLPNGYTPEGF